MIKILKAIKAKLIPESKPKELSYWLKHTEIKDDLITMDFSNVGRYKESKDYRAV